MRLFSIRGERNIDPILPMHSLYKGETMIHANGLFYDFKKGDWIHFMKRTIHILSLIFTELQARLLELNYSMG
jgi:hypothetical protein